MTPSSKNNSFTAEDIERYHSGKMPAAEMHALEKAALDDPFLADALEGYQYASTPANDLQKLGARLEERVRKKKSAPVVFFRKSWMKAAVVLLVVAGGGWLAYQAFEANDHSLATAQKKEVHAMPVPAPSNDSIRSTDVTVTKPPQKRRAGHETPKEIQAGNSVAAKNNASEKKGQAGTSLVASSGELVFKEESATNTSKDSAVTRNDAYGKNKGSLDAANNKNAAQANASVDQANNAPFATAPAANARRQASRTPDTLRNVDVVLKENPRPVTEVVLGKGRRKEAEEKGRLPRVIIDTLEPAEGYVHFDDYVANNLKTPEELQIKPVSGEIQLSFDVNQAGEPVNIQVVKSLCDKCDDEAVRLLKEGPKWKKKKNKKGKLTIHF